MSNPLDRHTIEIQDEIINDLREENGRLLEENECFEGMKAGVEIRIACLVEAGKEDRKSIDELVDENERLRGLLKGVVDDMVVGDDWEHLLDEIKREVGDE